LNKYDWIKLERFFNYILHFNSKNKTSDKGNTSYLVETAISPSLSYLLTVRLAASSAIPFNIHERKERKNKNIAN